MRTQSVLAPSCATSTPPARSGGAGKGKCGWEGRSSEGWAVGEGTGGGEEVRSGVGGREGDGRGMKRKGEEGEEKII